MKMNLKSLGILLTAGFAFTACTSDTLVEQTAPQQDKTWTVTATIGKDADTQTRALNLSSNTLNVGWTTTDKIYVKTAATGMTVGYLSPTADTDNSTTTVTGTLSGTEYSVNESFNLIFPRTEVDYTGQDGTLATIAEKYDYATGSTTVASVSGSNVTLAAATLTSQQAIAKFTFSTAIDEVMISSERLRESPLLIKLASPATDVYAAIPLTDGNGTATYQVTGYNSATLKHYEAMKTGVKMQNGKYYTASVNLTEYDAVSTPLTFEVIGSATPAIHFENPLQLGFKYKKNGGNFVEVAAGSDSYDFDAQPGDIIQVYGDNPKHRDGVKNCYFECLSDCYVYGNLMSLISSTSFSTLTTLTEKNALFGIFSKVNNFQEADAGNPHLLSHPYKDIVLPATKLTEECYGYMFEGCFNLTKAPTLPATTLAPYCYNFMFQRCTNLTKAPALPATTLAPYCYQGMLYMTGLTAAPELPATTLESHCYTNMFNRCTNLTTAPELPATTLTDWCYSQMFDGCTSLTAAPNLPATTLAEQCYSNMFYNCKSLTTVPASLPATSLAKSCYTAMFCNCTSLKTAPLLPATSSATGCYNSMFSGCSSLNSVTCLLRLNTNSSSTQSWLDGVASSGTLYINSELDPSTQTTWETGVNGIPANWTVQRYVAP